MWLSLSRSLRPNSAKYLFPGVMGKKRPEKNPATTINIWIFDAFDDDQVGYFSEGGRLSVVLEDYFFLKKFVTNYSKQMAKTVRLHLFFFFFFLGSHLITSFREFLISWNHLWTCLKTPSGRLCVRACVWCIWSRLRQMKFACFCLSFPVFLEFDLKILKWVTHTRVKSEFAVLTAAIVLHSGKQSSRILDQNLHCCQGFKSL